MTETLGGGLRSRGAFVGLVIEEEGWNYKKAVDIYEVLKIFLLAS